MNRFLGSQRPRRRLLVLPIATVFGLLLLLQSGCAHYTRMNTVVRVVIKECGTDQEYYSVHRWTPKGADYVVFENQDGEDRVVEFYQPAYRHTSAWPFNGGEHKIYLTKANPTASLQVSQFANPTAHADTFLFKITGEGPCGKGPTGPGIISED